MWQEDGKNGESSSSQSVAQMVAEAANSFITNELLPGFIYLTEQDMWYNSETGYFFDMKSSLYYHPSTGWLRYNTETNSYEVVEQKPKTKWKKKSRKRNANRVFGENYVESMDQETVDVCETLFDLVDRVEFLSGGSSKFAGIGQTYDDELGDYMKTNISRRPNFESDESDEEDEWSRRRAEEEESKYPPAVRLIDKTNMNKLYIISIYGGKIGYSDKCEIPLRITDSIAEEHVKISFVNHEDDRYYEIECLKKYIYLNDKRITKTNKARLEHGSQIIVGPYRLEIHIHNGNNTCPDCEPGILNSKLKEPEQKSSFKERRINHRQAMKSIKAQLGLNEFDDTSSTSDYQDRAAKRRKTVGSEPGVSTSSNIYGTCKATPVEGASTSSVQIKSQKAQIKPDLLNPENKGFKLLKSMGWKENTGLGKVNQGITAPIESTFKNDKKGLGSNQNHHQIKISFKDKRKLELIEKTRQRFDQAELEKRTQ